MPTNSPRASYDTFTKQDAPTSNTGNYKTINLNGSTTQARQPYLFFNPGIPLGCAIQSATLRLFVRGGFPGTAVNITAERITTAWKEGTLTWNNAPSVTATHAGSVSVTNPALKSNVDVDVTAMLGDVAQGSKFFGIRLRSTTTTATNKQFYSSEASNPLLRPQLIIVWSRAPLPPTDLAPAGGRAVSLAKPTFNWDVNDKEGLSQAAYDVRVATASTVDVTGMLNSGVVYDSGIVQDTVTDHDSSAGGTSRTASVTTTLSSTTITAASGTFSSADVGNTITGTGIPAGTTIATYTSSTTVVLSAAATAAGTVTATITPVFVSLVAGNVRYWQVKYQNSAGQWSPWSDVQGFNRTAKPTFTMNSPVNAGTVTDVSPLVITTLSTAQEAIQYELQEDDGTGLFRTLWKKLKFAAPATAGATYSFTIPAGYIKRTGRNYRVNSWAWDTVDRDVTPGDPPSVSASATFTFTTSATPAPVTVLTATPEGTGQEPGLRLDFNRASGQAAPDFFALKVDGVRIASRIDPADVFLSGTTTLLYRFYLYAFSPRENHTIEIEAVTNNGSAVFQHSQGNATAAVRTDPAGIWLVNDDLNNLTTLQPRRIRLLGSSQPSWSIGESSQVFYPLGRKDPVRVWDTVRGWEGEVSGTVRADDLVGTAALDNLEWMKTDDNVAEQWRVIAGRESFPATVGQLTPPPTRRPGALEYEVTLVVEQVGEFWT